MRPRKSRPPGGPQIRQEAANGRPVRRIGLLLLLLRRLAHRAPEVGAPRFAMAMPVAPSIVRYVWPVTRLSTPRRQIEQNAPLLGNRSPPGWNTSAVHAQDQGRLVGHSPARWNSGASANMIGIVDFRVTVILSISPSFCGPHAIAVHVGHRWRRRCLVTHPLRKGPGCRRAP